MKYEIKVPAVGESITEATIGAWMKKNGEAVKRNDVLLSLETDKASVEVVAENDGVLTILAEAGQTIAIGSIVGSLDSEGKASVAAAPTAAAPATGAVAPPAAGATTHPELRAHLSPAVQKIVSETGINPADVAGTGRGGRLTKQDVVQASSGALPPRGTLTPGSSPGNPSGGLQTLSPVTAKAPTVPQKPMTTHGEQRRVPMTTIRKRIAEKLVMSQQSTATLTTFNEVDMTKVMQLRAKYKDKFKEKFGVGLGFMGFFVKAAVEALHAYPAVNAFVDGTDLIYNDYHNIGVAVGTEKGLIVPVLKNAHTMSIASVENTIKEYALKARDGKISIDDLSGGTFTISNGGVYGSLMSTPILNPPQSAILGMHKIEDRAVVVDGQIVARPMMYLALSYDHRIIDGKEAVSFLVKIKEGIEEPERLLLEI
jgi:2-oxoglutarate dehydrogenase E2 component (dihydrolipoamide succinyltransferase)